VLENNVEVLKLKKKSKISLKILLKYTAKSLKNCCVLKILQESLMMLQYESNCTAV